ncbi:MAG: hypothetical protein ASARMPREDX12_006387 [Alectoria sarmentosa]|nr:MAG: hypothetical protein ASARMPREDX12_006387 [Alectoria sarmentosa]
MDDQELQPVSNNSVVIKSNAATQNGPADRDHADLIRLGKKPVLRRNFGFMSILGFSCTVLTTWEATLNGGPAGLIYGFIIVWAGTAAVFASLSELASMAPTAGGQYHWVSMLAPHSSRKLFSYVTGRFKSLRSSLAGSDDLQAGSQLGGGRLMSLLLFWAAVGFAVFVNTVIGRLLPRVEGFILVVHVLGFFAIILPLIFFGQHQDASEVFGTFLNNGYFPTKGLSFMVGIVGTAFPFLGADGAIHMSEEIQNAALVVPRSVMISIFINGALGFAVLLVTLFSLNDIEKVLKTPTAFPYMQVFLDATGSVAGASVMAGIIAVMSFSANIGILATASRMCWSFCRDRGLPGWQLLQHVDPHTALPIRSILFTMLVSILLSLIVLGSSTAFNDLVGLTVAALNSSYLIASGLLLYRRCTGGILPRHMSLASKDSDDTRLVFGPWYLPGMYGTAVNAFACVYLTVLIFFCMWPSELPVSAENMNYTALVTMVVVAFSIGYYHFWARRIYTGPVVEIN